MSIKRAKRSLPSVQEAARWWQQVSTGKDARRLRQALAEKEEENKQLQTLVRGYERGRFIRAMRAIRRLRNRFS